MNNQYVNHDHGGREPRETKTSPDAIERQIDERRSRIDRQLDELEQRLSPRHLMDQGMDMFKDHGGELANSLSRSFRENPAPFIVAGVGIAWLMASTSRSTERGYAGDRTHGRDYQYDAYDSGYPGFSTSGDGYEGGYNPGGMAGEGPRTGDEQNADESLLDKAGEVADEVGQRASDLLDGAARRVDSARARSALHAHRARREAQQQMALLRDGGRAVRYRTERSVDTLSRYLQEQPLAGGLIGLAAGALIGSLLPGSEMENKLMGRQSDELMRKAEERASSAAEVAREKVESAASSARETVQQEIDKQKVTEASEQATTGRTAGSAEPA